MFEGAFQGPQEIVRRLPMGRFAVGLAAVRQDDAEDVRAAPLAVRIDDRRAGPEVDLSLLAESAFQPPERQRPRPANPLEESPHAVVADRCSVLGDQVLVNPPGRQPLGLLGLDDLPPRLTVAVAAGKSAAWRNGDVGKRRCAGRGNRRIGWD
jgi:hypothetical protein